VVGADPRYIADSFKETADFWRCWIGRSTYQGRWRDEVHRSALILKLLHCRRTGAIVAAATFGLPEEIGGVRNWDYRYTWIRDASFTLYALIRLGLSDETADFIDWLGNRAGADHPANFQIVYGIDGRKDLPEYTLDHLEGYRGSRPVRVGNAASKQLQLDIYGELMDSLYLYDKHGEATSHELWQRIAATVEWVGEHWNQPDEGFWEVRSERRHFLASRVMCWVAIDRGIRLAFKRSVPAPLERWRAARDAIYRDVWDNFWDPSEQAFVGHKGSTRLDAACLLMPLVRFASPTDPRWLSTLRAVERRLAHDSLVHRYEIVDEKVDGLSGTEGTVSICSFWYVECLSRAGDLEQARLVFEKMLGYANHLGLYAEELGKTGEHLGNFPQAFTHLALISAAYDLDRRLSRRVMPVGSSPAGHIDSSPARTSPAGPLPPRTGG
jgi:GH15 family glucan-1,4-alpha-glucosidase